MNSVGEEGKSSVTGGAGLNYDVGAKTTRLNIKLGASKRYDSLEFGVEGVLSTDTKLLGKKTFTATTNAAGNILSLTPSVTFMPNDKDRLTGGVVIQSKDSDIQNGQTVDFRRSDSSLFLGASHQIDKKNILHANVTTGSSSSLGSTISFGLAHEF